MLLCKRGGLRYSTIQRQVMYSTLIESQCTIQWMEVDDFLERGGGNVVAQLTLQSYNVRVMVF